MPHEYRDEYLDSITPDVPLPVPQFAHPNKPNKNIYDPTPVQHSRPMFAQQPADLRSAQEIAAETRLVSFANLLALKSQ